MAVRTNFVAGEVLTAQDLDDTFASKLPYSYGTATPSTTDSGFLWYDSNSTPAAAKFWDGSAFQPIGQTYVELASGSLSGSEVSITGISQEYTDLRLEIFDAQVGSGGNYLGVRFNSNTGNVYEGVAIRSVSTTVQTYVGSYFNMTWNGEALPTSASTYSYLMEIKNYSATERKWITGMWNQTDNVWVGGHCFNDTTAVSSIQIRSSAGSVFAAGTYVVKGIR